MADSPYAHMRLCFQAKLRWMRPPTMLHNLCHPINSCMAWRKISCMGLSPAECLKLISGLITAVCTPCIFTIY